MTQSGDDAAELASARAMLKRVMQDPRHLSETLATFGVGRLGPEAARRVGEMRATRPGWDVARCRTEVLRRGTRATVARGALVGGPLLALAPYGFCAALLVQNRIVLELAALAGRDPTADERAAELLVLQDAYADVEAARTGLAQAREAGPQPKPAGKVRTLWRVTWRLANLLGLTGHKQQGDRPVPWWLRLLRWALLGATFAVSLVAPLVWMPYMADSYRQSTDRIARRAELFYFGNVTTPRRTPDHAPRRLALASVLFTAALVLLTLVVGIRLFDRTWVAVVAALLAGSLGGAAAGAALTRRRSRQA